MKILVTGACGQLGYDVVREVTKRDHEVIVSDLKYDARFSVRWPLISYAVMDITNRRVVDNVLKEHMPDVIIHCAAFTDVDKAQDEKMVMVAEKINDYGTKNLADTAQEIGAKFIYISTDYVFNGSGEQPWSPDCEEFGPLNNYGKTKLYGEWAVRDRLEKYYIVRTSGLFGVNGKNFIRTMVNAGKTHDYVYVVSDEILVPTYTVDLAKLLVDMAEKEKYGIYHATNEGPYASWFDICCQAFGLLDIKSKVIPIPQQEWINMNYPKPIAVRPKNSKLFTSKLKENGFELLPDWRNAVERYLTQEFRNS